MMTPYAAWCGAAGDALTTFLFPQGCHVCGGVVQRRADGVACGDCWDDPGVTPLFSGLALWWRGGLRGVTPAGGSCASCAPAALGAVRSAGAYAGALRAA